MNLNLDKAIVNSALWAAAGDALGWISELTDARGLRRRIGGSELREPVAWRRKIGGIGGISVDLPAGTYSDDTQLRLSVCRAIQGDGTFDVELFAKIELTVWPAYALGAGRGSKAAAVNLAKRDVNWFSNFFAYGDGRTYVDGGGNGAAMRIQPHVWRRAGGPDRTYLLDVVRDSITTHGHMLGLCGAVFHADCLAFALRNKEMPGPDEWLKFVDGFAEIVPIVTADYELGRFWLSAWEQASKVTLAAAIEAVAHEMRGYILKLGEFAPELSKSYRKCIEVVNGFGERQGAGANTALAAAFLAWAGQDSPIDAALLSGANVIGSDTDTIGTMAGALLGVIASSPPTWQIQDAEYIRYQALRMAKIARGDSCDAFTYPDLIGWLPPATQSDALGETNGRLAIVGLGYLEAVGPSWQSGGYAWEWLRLEFGQTILCKRRVSGLSNLAANLIPGQSPVRKVNVSPATAQHSGLIGQTRGSQVRTVGRSGEGKQSDRVGSVKRERPQTPSLGLFDEQANGDKLPNDRNEDADQHALQTLAEPRMTLHALTDTAIRSNFDPRVIGDCLTECFDAEDGIERAMGFTAIIAKAFIVRKRRRG